MVPYTGTQHMELQVVYPNDPPPRNAVHNLVRCIKDPSPPKPALKSGIVTVWADFSRKKSKLKRKSGEHHRNGRAMRYKQRTTMMLWAAVVSCAFCVSFSSRPTTAFVAPSPTIYQAMSRRMEVNSRRHASVASKPPIRDRFALNRKRAVSARVYKPRTESSTRTLMTSGFGGGGGRGPRRPLGLSPGTLGTIFFWVLVLFAPGVILGAFNTLFLLVILGPLLLSLGVNIYNKINTIAAPCPVCGIQLSGLKNAPSECPSCGTMVVAEGDKFEAVGSGFLRDEMGTQEKFSRSMDSGVIDVEAIDIDD